MHGERATSFSSATDAHLLGISFERGFEREAKPTLGIEEELILVDPESLEPAVENEWLVAVLADERRFKPELRAAQLELVTPVCANVPDVLSELANARAQVVDAAGGSLRIFAAGTHPLSTQPVAINQRARYLEIARDNPWFVRCGLPSALHVHVGVGEPNDALAIYNAVRSYLPELAALAANSPFFEGRDTGLSSSRLKLCEDSPRAGIPPALASWQELASFVAWGARGRLFPDLSYLWWDLRPRPDYGTLEFRITDSQTHLASTAAIVAVCQTLVVSLQARLRDGEQLPVHPTHVLNENRWRALRSGLDGELVDPVTGAPEPTRDRLWRLLDELQPHAVKLRCTDQLADARALLTTGGGANEQRTIAEQCGLEGLVEWLADTTENSARMARHTAGLRLPPEPARTFPMLSRRRPALAFDHQDARARKPRHS